MSTDLLQQSWFAQLERSALSDTLTASVRDVLDRLATNLDEYEEAQRHINASSEYSDTGKQTHVAQLQLSRRQNAEKIAAPLLKQLAEQISELEMVIGAKRPVSGDVVQAELRAGEIRRHLTPLSELERIEILQTSAINGNGEIVGAVVNAPVPLVSSASALREAQQALGEALSPQDAQTLRAAVNAEAQVRSALRASLAAMGANADPIRAVAEGTAAA